MNKLFEEFLQCIAEFWLEQDKPGRKSMLKTEGGDFHWRSQKIWLGGAQIEKKIVKLC